MVIKKIRRLIRAIFSLCAPRSWGPFVETYEKTRFDHAFSVSWSQAGEDLAILAALGNVKNLRYLDVGAHHPSRFSVTRHLFENGWTGVNVDANIDLISNFENSRPKDVNLNRCVGSLESYEISIFKETAISTVDAAWAAKFRNENNEISEVRIVPGISLRELITRYFPQGDLEFLNVDIEGADIDALESAGFASLDKKLWPNWILVEADPPISRLQTNQAVQFMFELGYEIFLVLPFACLLKLPVTRT